jgi:NDP-sugar pyrophosphorylase family protein
MTLLLMAAGRGSRYGKLKQFDDLGPHGEFLMEFSIHDALSNGFDQIVVITQRDNVSFLEDHLKARLPEGIRLNIIAQEISDLPEGSEFQGQREKPWGTAHAVWSARSHITTPFAVINADDYYGRAAYTNAAEFIRNCPDPETYGLVAYTLRDTLSDHGSVSRGVCERKGTSLLSVEERIKIAQQPDGIRDLDTGLTFTGDEPVSMNFWVCRPSVFNYIEKDLRTFLDQEDPSAIQTGEVYLPMVIKGILQDNAAPVEVIPSESQWFGVTYADDKEKAVSMLQEMTNKGYYPSPLWPAAGNS